MICKRCKRKLKSESSVKLGYGHTCAIKSGVIKIKKRKVYKGNDDYYSLEEFINGN